MQFNEQSVLIETKRGVKEVDKGAEVYNTNHETIFNWFVSGLGIGQITLSVHEDLKLLKINSGNINKKQVLAILQKTLLESIYEDHEEIVEKEDLFNLEVELEKVKEDDDFSMLEDFHVGFKVVKIVKEIEPLKKEKRRFEVVSFRVNLKSFKEMKLKTYKEYLKENCIGGNKKIITISKKEG